MIRSDKLYGLLAAFLCMTVAAGCSKETKYCTSVPDGGQATLSNNIHFYFIDEDGNMLIDNENPETFPIPCESDGSTPEITELKGDYYYVSREEGPYFASRIRKDQDDRTFFTTYFPVDFSSDRYSFFIYFDGAFIKYDLTYGYTNDGIGGNGWTARILSLEINGQDIYVGTGQDSRYRPYTSVYIQKSGDDISTWSE